MTKSDELCKLLGIEPKCLNEEYSGCKYADDDSRQCCKKYKENNCEYSMYWIYPDLTKPSNFVKLLEIYHKVRYPYFNGFNKKNEVIETQLIIQMLNYCEKNNIVVDDIKHQAQQTEWEY